MSNKRFSANWNPSVFAGPAHRDVDQSFFTEDAGYTPKEIAEIDALAVGEVWESDDYGPDHTVKRTT